jgi:hypothetical protein
MSQLFGQSYIGRAVRPCLCIPPSIGFNFTKYIYTMLVPGSRVFVGTASNFLIPHPSGLDFSGLEMLLGNIQGYRS